MSETTNGTTLTEDKNTNTRYLKSGNTTVKVTEHFSGEQTYLDIIKAALRRELER